MQKQETQVTPISDAAKQPSKLSEKEQKKLDRDMEKLRVQAREFYDFFRMGGALNLVQFKSMSELDHAAVSMARRLIREEDAKFQMKCMMAMFNNAIDRMTGKTTEPAPNPEENPDAIAVSGMLDEIQGKS